jgi:fibronectin-binding autotransporter adhesin
MLGRTGRKWTAGMVGLIAIAALLGAPQRSVGQCLGDCAGDNQVEIADLVIGVDIALGTQPLSVCPAFDDGSGMVTIAVLITAVDNSLGGCPGASLVVDTLADTTSADACSLRDAINIASGRPVSGSGCGQVIAHSIFFVEGLSGTIVLTETLPSIAGDVSIQGPANDGITISGEHHVRVLTIEAGASAVLRNLTIANGDVNDGGAGIKNSGALYAQACTVRDNRSAISSGGIVNMGGEMTIVQSTFLTNAGAAGGAILSLGGNVTIENSTFSANASGDGPGGAIDASGSLTVFGSTFSANTSRGSGAAIAVGGTAVIINSTFANNVSNAPGGAVSASGNATIIASTFAGNSATAQFAGSAIFVSSGGSITLKSTALARPADLFPPICLTSLSGPIVNGGYNISADASCGFGTSTGASGQTIGDSVDPMFDPAGLQNNGGPTQTIALLPNSPAVAAIPPASCTDENGDPLTIDQRGEPRPTQSPCDIGAFELSE